MFEGVTITIGGREFIIPPLSFKQVKALWPIIQEISKPEKTIVDAVDGFTQVVHAAISRNYPDVTQEEIADLLDFGNVNKIINDILGVSGFVLGEKKAGNDQTLMKSMPTS